MAGISQHCKTGDVVAFGDSVGVASKALCGLTEAAGQVRSRHGTNSLSRVSVRLLSSQLSVICSSVLTRFLIQRVLGMMHCIQTVWYSPLNNTNKKKFKRFHEAQCSLRVTFLP